MACLSFFVLMIIFGSFSATSSQDCSVYWSSHCSAICSTNNINPDITEGFYLYKEISCLLPPTYKTLQNNSTVYSFVHNESHCSKAIWCVSNSSASGTVLRWHLPDSNATSETIELCLCTYITGIGASNDMQGCYSNKEGVHKCVQDDDNNSGVSSTLQFRHNISSLNSNEMCSTQMTITHTLCMATSTVTMQKDCSPTVSSSLISNNYSTTSSMSSPNFLSSTLIMPSTLSSLSTSSAFSTSVSSMIFPVQSSSTVPHYTGIGLLVATNLLTIIALISSCVYIFCQRKKSKFTVTENEQISLQNTSPQTEGTSHNTETSPTSNNNTNITSGTNIYSSVEDEVDHHHHHHHPPARVASQYEVPLDLLQQAHVPLPPPPPLYALDDQHDLTLPNPEYVTNTTVTAPNPGYITNIAAKPNPGYSTTAIKEGEGGERGEGERREELDYSYATVNKFLKKPTEDTELQHE